MFEIKKGVNKFYIGDTSEKPLAEIILTDINQDLITIEHTFVDEQLKGQGVGSVLVKEVVEFATKENKKLIPLCSFAKKEFDKNNEYKKVLYEVES
jgi:predicted GNAT family acetyltransferase